MLRDLCPHEGEETHRKRSDIFEYSVHISFILYKHRDMYTLYIVTSVQGRREEDVGAGQEE